MVADSAVDLSATVVVALDEGPEVDDNGGPHVHGAVDDHVNADADIRPAAVYRPRRWAAPGSSRSGPSAGHARPWCDPRDRSPSAPAAPPTGSPGSGSPSRPRTCSASTGAPP